MVSQSRLSLMKLVTVKQSHPQVRIDESGLLDDESGCIVSAPLSSAIQELELVQVLTMSSVNPASQSLLRSRLKMHLELSFRSLPFLSFTYDNLKKK